MKTKQKKHAAKKLGWTNIEFEVALQEFMDTGSVLVKDDLIEVCLSADNAQDRILKCVEYYLKSYIDRNKGEKEDKFLDLISDLLLNEDPCFSVIALFNISDCFRSNKSVFKVPKHKDRMKIAYDEDRKSFINWKVDTIIRKHRKIHRPVSRYLELLYDFDLDIYHPMRLKYKLLDIMLRAYEGIWPERIMFPKLAHYLHVQSNIRQVAERAGFMLFNIPEFRDAISILYTAPNSKEFRENISKLNQALIPTLQKKKLQTEERNWFSFVLVEKIIETKGIRTYNACGYAKQILGEKRSTLRTRYYKYRKEAKKQKLSLAEIIEMHDFKTELEEKLREGKHIEEESLYELTYATK